MKRVSIWAAERFVYFFSFFRSRTLDFVDEFKYDVKFAWVLII